MSIFVLVVGLVLFIFLIIVHEMGHFLVAERNAVKAEEFGIFFPPRLYKHRTKKGWLFTINALPLGGFVKLKGEHDTDSGPGSYGAASTWAKAKIMAAGVFMNLVTALVLLTVLAWIGLPQLIPAQFKVNGASHVSKQEVLVSYVQPGSPAAKAGIKQENQIVAIGTTGHLQNILNTNQLFNATKNNAGKTVEIIYRSSGVQFSKQLALLSLSTVAASQNTSQPKGYLGVSPAPLTLRQFSWWGGPVEAVGLSLQVIKLTFVGLGHALAGLGRIIAGLVTANTHARQAGQKAASSQVAGPVGIFVILKDGSALGYQYMLFIIAIVSLTLAIMNILPIPALDGGRLWLMLISRGVGRQLSASVEEVVNAVGMIVLLALIVLITLVDVHRFL